MYNSGKAGYTFSEALLVDRKMRLRVWLKKMLINLSLLLFFPSPNVSSKSGKNPLSSSCLLIPQINHLLPLPSLIYLKYVPQAGVALVPLPAESSLN